VLLDTGNNLVQSCFYILSQSDSANCEFLAAESVVKTFDNTIHYQHILIDKASQQK